MTAARVGWWWRWFKKYYSWGLRAYFSKTRYTNTAGVSFVELRNKKAAAAATDKDAMRTCSFGRRLNLRGLNLPATWLDVKFGCQNLLGGGITVRFRVYSSFFLPTFFIWQFASATRRIRENQACPR